jgi:hypothetical protein
MAVAVGGLAQLLAAVDTLEGVGSVHLESIKDIMSILTKESLAKVSQLDV